MSDTGLRLAPGQPDDLRHPAYDADRIVLPVGTLKAGYYTFSTDLWNDATLIRGSAKLPKQGLWHLITGPTLADNIAATHSKAPAGVDFAECLRSTGLGLCA